MNENQKELCQLKFWFNKEYSYKEQKYRRLIELKKVDDDGSDPYTKLIELYQQAEIKRTRIQKLEQLVK